MHTCPRIYIQAYVHLTSRFFSVSFCFFCFMTKSYLGANCNNLNINMIAFLSTRPFFPTRKLWKHSFCLKTRVSFRAHLSKPDHLLLPQIWPQADYPLIPVGKMVLNENPSNYFADVEQIAFSPSHLVPGIEPSPDKMLQVSGTQVCWELHRLCAISPSWVGNWTWMFSTLAFTVWKLWF